MNIEKLYYDEYKALMQEVQKQDEAEQASLTEVEKLRFVTNMVVLGKDSPHIFKRVLSRLITAADHIWIDTKHVDNEVLVQIEFWFDLCDNEDEIVN